ncbi:hypothetical protein Nepgr_008345 [Nepenthes gracilis]|uniref:Uncharacterized protein n=1 Tax=Nepenthes gracilis TaxID=150966 RepID=A0AAD3S8V5_NEPGR|nr:hypothetical protein Nepgr_008345 [Nepenthes gracilis]
MFISEIWTARVISAIRAHNDCTVIINMGLMNSIRWFDKVWNASGLGCKGKLPNRLKCFYQSCVGMSYSIIIYPEEWWLKGGGYQGKLIKSWSIASCKASMPNSPINYKALFGSSLII